MSLLIELFWSFCQIGLFSIGGGYAAMPLIQEQVVTKHQWLTMAEFTDLITISEMTPGPIALNSASFVGLRVAGFPGAVVATLGNVLPSFIIVSILAYIYYRFKKISIVQGVIEGLRPTVVALIATAGVGILLTALTGQGYILNATILIVSLFLLRKVELSPIKVIVLSGVVGVLVELFL